jgi:RimJ/RimL family protein N-acetyltransferase
MGEPVRDVCRIRPVQPGDAAALLASLNLICREGGAFYATEVQLAEPWETALYRPDSVPDHLVAVVEWDGQFAGAGNLFPGRTNTLCRHVADLGLFVLPPFRRQGVGKQLLGWMLAWAAQTGLEKITLGVFASNRPAIQLYSRFGFVEEGRQQRQVKVDGQYIDLLLMALFLEPHSG